MKKGTITLKIMGVLVSIGGFCAYLCRQNQEEGRRCPGSYV